MATYTGYVIGQFKAKYPHVHSMADAGEVLWGPLGREVLGTGQMLFFIFIMGSHILTFSIMMNAITEHGACTIIWSVLALVLSLLFTLPRTLKNVAHMSISSFISVTAAVVVTMVAVSIINPGMGQIDYVTRPSFHNGFLAVANIVFAYAGHVAFFGFISELREPKDYPKALCLLQISDTSMYIVVAIVVYWYAGKDVASPALDSAGKVLRKVAYGLAIPTASLLLGIFAYSRFSSLTELFRSSSRASSMGTWPANIYMSAYSAGRTSCPSDRGSHGASGRASERLCGWLLGSSQRPSPCSTISWASRALSSRVGSPTAWPGCSGCI